ncbi:MAG: hypothetical protein ACRC6X_04850 [Culicoidibacterales bacterium]
MRFSFNKLSVLVESCEIVKMNLNILENKFEIILQSYIIDEKIQLIFNEVMSCVYGGEREKIYEDNADELFSLLDCSIYGCGKRKYNISLELVDEGFFIHAKSVSYKIGEKYEGVLELDSGFRRKINKGLRKLRSKQAYF